MNRNNKKLALFLQRSALSAGYLNQSDDEDNLSSQAARVNSFRPRSQVPRTARCKEMERSRSRHQA